MQALILAGGSGTRFWPLSRRSTPKQLLALDGEATLLQRTAGRLHPLLAPRDIWVCTTAALAEQVAAQLPAVPRAQVLAEPVGRNTAPAIAWAVASMPVERRNEPVLVLPADHRIADDEAFRAALGAAAGEAAAGRVLALGVTPRWAETGYGYLELGERIDGGSGLRRVVRFVEKPDRARAEAFLASGRYLWNGGIFAFRGDRLLALVAAHLPALSAGLAAIDPAARDREAGRRLAEIYPTLPAISIDHGLMEKLDEIATLPLDCGWSDLGSWQALAEELPRDGAGNSTRGAVVAIDCRDSLVWADRGTVAVLGLDGLVVVRTGDAVLVLPKDRAQEVKTLVEALAAEGREDLL